MVTIACSPAVVVTASAQLDYRPAGIRPIHGYTAAVSAGGAKVIVTHRASGRTARCDENALFRTADRRWIAGRCPAW
jgi:hypothetical protein